jgi:hypothetical protein
MDIEFINKKLEIKYYKSVKQTLQKMDINEVCLINHLEKLCDELSNENKITETITEKKKEKELVNSSSETEKTENHKQIFADDDLYKKPWPKLNSIHKILKVKEFVNNLKMDSEKDRIKLKDELVCLIKEKILTKKEKVKYDDVNGKIISLPNLQYKNNKYFYLNE